MYDLTALLSIEDVYNILEVIRINAHNNRLWDEHLKQKQQNS